MSLNMKGHVCHNWNPLARRSCLHSFPHSFKPSSGKAVRRQRGHGTTVASSGATELRELGSSGLKVPACCLGTMTWGKQNTEAEAHEQLNYAFDQGINFLDTAEMYPVPPAPEVQGRTDKYIGTWLKGVQRDKVILATKVAGYGNPWIRGGKDTDTITRVSPSQIEQSVDESLERLGTDYVDLLQVHWPDRHVALFGAQQFNPDSARWETDIPFEEQLQGLAAVVKSGKVRHIGVSNETSYGVMKFVQAAKDLGLPRIVSIQNNYSLLVRLPYDTNLGEVCHPKNENVGLLAYSPLAGGVLTGKYIDGNASKDCRLNLFEGYMARYNASPARAAVAEYCKLAKKYEVTPTQLAIAWCNQRWTTTSTIIGATKMDQLKENIGAFDVKLPEEAFKDIEELHATFKDPARL